jgi:hypothetical protein
MNQSISNNHYKTSDTALTAYLQLEGYIILDLDTATQRATFTINISEDDPKLVELVGLFYAGRARVEPTTFLRNYRILSRQAREG